MTYTELRAAIAANITDQAALVALLTPENVRTVAACAPGVGVPVAYVQGDMVSVFDAGQTVADGMYDDKSTPRTVDQVLAWFAPANIYAAQVYIRLAPALDEIDGNLNDFLNNVDAQANETAPLLC